MIANLAEVKTVIKSIINSFPDQMPIDRLEKDFKEMEGYFIPYSQFGFRQLDLFLRSIPDTVTVLGSGRSSRVIPVYDESTEHVRKLVLLNKKSSGSKRMPDRKQHNSNYNQSHSRPSSSHGQRYPVNIGGEHFGTPHFKAGLFTTPPFNQLLHTAPNYYNQNFQRGDRQHQHISAKNIAQNYNPKHNQSSYFAASCANSSASLSSQMSESYIRNFAPPPPTTNSFKSTTKSGEKPPPQQAKMQQKVTPKPMNEALPDLDKFGPIISYEMPLSEVISYGESIAPPIIPDTIVRGQLIPVFISEVHNANRLWLQLCERARDIDQLMNNIEIFYKDLESEKWTLQPSNIHKEVVCAARFLGMWHRAKVVGELKKNKVKIFFVDYGTCAMVEISNLKYLAKKFARMPAQAIRASLAFLKPVDVRWTRDSTRDLLTMVYEKLLYAQIVDVDKQNNSLDIVLIDTTGKNDVLIHHRMFIKGHAKDISTDAYLNEDENAYRRRARTYNEKYPAFELLENGTYPSFDEIGVYLAKGFDYEKFYLRDMTRFTDLIQDHIRSKGYMLNSGYYSELIYGYIVDKEDDEQKVMQTRKIDLDENNNDSEMEPTKN